MAAARGGAEGCNWRRLGVGSIAADQRLEAWTELNYWHYFPLEMTSPKGTFSHGELTILDLPGVRFCIVDSDAMLVDRGRQHLPLGGGDYLFLPIPLEQPLGLHQAGRELLLQPKDFGFITTADSYRYLQHTANRLVTLRIEARSARDRIPLIDDLTAVRMASDAPLPRIFVDFAVSVMAQGDRLAQEDAARLTAHLLDLLGLALSAPIAALESSESAVRLAHLRRIYGVIDSNLGTFELGLDFVAQALGLSPRYVQVLLADRGETLTGLIRARRLAEAERRLSDPSRRGQSVAAIGYSLGFAAPAHFSRTFKTATGLSPLDFRRRAGL